MRPGHADHDAAAGRRASIVWCVQQRKVEVALEAR